MAGGKPERAACPATSALTPFANRTLSVYIPPALVERVVAYCFVSCGKWTERQAFCRR